MENFLIPTYKVKQYCKLNYTLPEALNTNCFSVLSKTHGISTSELSRLGKIVDDMRTTYVNGNYSIESKYFKLSNNYLISTTLMSWN